MTIGMVIMYAFVNVFFFFFFISKNDNIMLEIGNAICRNGNTVYNTKRFYSITSMVKIHTAGIASSFFIYVLIIEAPFLRVRS